MNPQSPTAMPTMPAAPAPAPMQPPAGVTPPPTNQPMQLNASYGHDKLAIASLVLGIISLPASILTIFTVPIPILGIVLGFVSLKKNKGMAVAGIVLSIIGIVLTGALLTYGVKQVNKQKTNSSSSSSSASADNVSSACYSFDLPSGFSNTDITSNADCQTKIQKIDGTDRIDVASNILSTPLTNANHDSLLLALESKGEQEIDRLGGKVTNKSFITMDGVQVYKATGTEPANSTLKYFGLLIAFSPKEYTSSTGSKLRVFALSYDSSTSQNRFDDIVKSWKWQ